MANPADPRSPITNPRSPITSSCEAPYNEALRRILASWNVCSKEWVIRQYDHEVQGGSVIKPLVGAADDGPSDAAVIRPVLGSNRGLAIACGMNPRYGDIDPYWMAASAIDEAIRNCVAVGADPDRIAILDNFCWGNTDRPEELGSLVRAALACRDIATAYGTPFISGKDSLNNEFKMPDGSRIVIPPTLLISAIGQIDDVRQCVTMDLKRPGNLLYLVGFTANEFGGSMYSLVREQHGGNVPVVDPKTAQCHARRIHEAIRRGLVCSCHDLSEGGLAVALAEMALAGGLGADIDLAYSRPGVLTDELTEDAAANIDFPLLLLFAESNSRFIVEVPIDQATAFEALMDRPGDTPLMCCSAVELGVVSDKPRLRIGDTFDLQGTPSNGRPTEGALDRVAPLIAIPVSQLKDCWQRPLRW